MSTPLNKLQPQRTTVKSLVESAAYDARLKKMLGEKAQSFVSSLIQLSQSWQLQECDPDSVIASAMIAATLDLPIDKNLGFAHIVPYAKKAQFQMGYKGFIQLGLRSGQYKGLNAGEVYEGEFVSYDRIRAILVIDPSKRTSNKVVGYFAYMALITGLEHTSYWEEEEVEAHAQQFSQAYRSGKDTPWRTNFDAMALKTVLKEMLSKWSPLSIQMQKALVEDQGVRDSIDVEATVYPDNDPGAIQGGEASKPIFDGPEREKQPETTPAATKRREKKAQATETPPAASESNGGTPESEYAPIASTPVQPTTAAVPVEQPKKDLIDLDKPPRENLVVLCNRDGITPDQVLAYCKMSKLVFPETTGIEKVGEAIIRKIVINWSSIAPIIKNPEAAN